MRFICKDIDPQAKFTDLFSPQLTTTNPIVENGNTLSLANNNFVKGQGQQSFYGNVNLKDYYNTKNADVKAKTIASFATYLGVTITTNILSAALTDTYIFYATKAMKIKTACWFTIITDNGIIFTLPQRLTTSVCINNYTVNASYYNYWGDNLDVENEAGSDYVIDINSDDTVIPTVIDSTIKTMIKNVEISKNDYIFIQINQTVNPLDYVIYNGKNYIIISQKRDKDQIVYIAVKENIDSYTFIGANIIPAKIIPQLYLRSNESSSTNYTMNTTLQTQITFPNTTMKAATTAMPITIAIDTHSGWSTNQYTIPLTGNYIIMFKCRFGTSSTTSSMTNAVELQIYKNGAKYKRFRRYMNNDSMTSPGNWRTDFQDSLYLICNSGDVLTFFLYQDSGIDIVIWGIDATQGFTQPQFELELIKIDNGVVV